MMSAAESMELLKINFKIDELHQFFVTGAASLVLEWGRELGTGKLMMSAEQ